MSSKPFQYEVKIGDELIIITARNVNAAGRMAIDLCNERDINTYRIVRRLPRAA